MRCERPGSAVKSSVELRAAEISQHFVARFCFDSHNRSKPEMSFETELVVVAELFRVNQRPEDVFQRGTAVTFGSRKRGQH